LAQDWGRPPRVGACSAKMSKDPIYGDSQVLCQGRFVTGPDARSCIATSLMIALPSIVWHFEVGMWFVESRDLLLLVLLAAFLQVGSLTLLMGTALSDPGIVPRQDAFTERYDEVSRTHRMKQPPKYCDVLLRGHNFKMKYCSTCNIYRPPRCTHCSVCENCVERFDHHCPWIGNCVGKRNYWLFFSFVSFTGLLNTFTVATCIVKVVGVCKRRQEVLNQLVGRAILGTLTEAPVTFVLALYATGLVWFTVGLCMYHTYLISTNQTTYEQVKGAYHDGHNPFNRGIARNFCKILCSRVRPRYFDGKTGLLVWPPAPSPAIAARELRYKAALYAPTKADE